MATSFFLFLPLITASRNNSRTVFALLLALHFKNIILRENPSIQPWITIFHQIRESCPSRCQSEFGQGNWYFLGGTVAPHLKRVFWGSNVANLSLILLRWTRNPIDLKKPAMKLYPVALPWLDMFPWMIKSSSLLGKLSEPLISSNPYSVTLLWIVHLEMLSLSRWIPFLEALREPQQEF